MCMNKLLYPRLAAVNMGKQKKLYIPYIISAVFTIAMYYIMCAVKGNEGLGEMRGALFLPEAISMGLIVIGVFACIFLLYTNSFLIKQRKKEFGLYNVLGMEKKHIAAIMFFETIYAFLISLVGGLAFGMLFDKLTSLLLYRLLKFEIKLGFYISFSGILYTAILFGGIFLINLIYNIIKVYRTKPVELLHGGNVGEKEPKAKIIPSILGVLFLGAGYTIAIVTESPLNAIPLFMVAVLCVIFGTYLLFMTGSIAALKSLKKNKKYYYNKKHFNSVSGMLYRMKQNAAGLANICILSTMVLVMVSTTVSLYTGTEDALQERYPKDIAVDVHCSQFNDEDQVEFHPEEGNEMDLALRKKLQESGIRYQDYRRYQYICIIASWGGTQFHPEYFYGDSTEVLYFFSADSYKTLTGKNAVLRDGEVLVYSEGGTQIGDSLSVMNKTYKVAGHTDSFTEIPTFYNVVKGVHVIVVPDQTELQELFTLYTSARGQADIYHDVMDFNLTGTAEEKRAQGETLKHFVYDAMSDKGYFSFDAREAQKAEYYEMNGSFLFLGIVLGLLFLIVTVMIIYYKQISEGYSDRERFLIMQKVGMSRAEVKGTIRSQVLTVFFLPLVTACIHLAFSYPIVSKLLRMFGLMNQTIFILSLAVTAAVFAVIYVIVYLLTARTYYKIVSQ